MIAILAGFKKYTVKICHTEMVCPKEQSLAIN